MRPLRFYLPNRAPNGGYALTNKGSRGTAVYPVKTLFQIIGGRTWSLSVIRLGDPTMTDEWAPSGPIQEPEPEIVGKCSLCGDDLVWHPGNGGQWLGAHPPRDWATCFGSVDGPKHSLDSSDPRPCKGRNTNICVAEGCYGEACRDINDGGPR